MPDAHGEVLAHRGFLIDRMYRFLSLRAHARSAHRSVGHPNLVGDKPWAKPHIEKASKRDADDRDQADVKLRARR
jgi:hypothetical protein